VFSLSRQLKLNLNSRLVVIFVLRLAKLLSKNTKQNRSAKVKVTQCQTFKAVKHHPLEIHAVGEYDVQMLD